MTKIEWEKHQVEQASSGRINKLGIEWDKHWMKQILSWRNIGWVKQQRENNESKEHKMGQKSNQTNIE